MWAAMYGLRSAAQLLISNGAEVNAVGALQKTSLMWAALYGYDEVVRLLIDNGAQVNAIDDDRSSPLILVALNGHHPSFDRQWSSD